MEQEKVKTDDVIKLLESTIEILRYKRIVLGSLIRRNYTPEEINQEYLRLIDINDMSKRSFSKINGWVGMQ